MSLIRIKYGLIEKPKGSQFSLTRSRWLFKRSLKIIHIYEKSRSKVMTRSKFI